MQNWDLGLGLTDVTARIRSSNRRPPHPKTVLGLTSNFEAAAALYVQPEVMRARCSSWHCNHYPPSHLEPLTPRMIGACR